MLIHGLMVQAKDRLLIHFLFKSRSNAIMMAGQIVKALLTAALTKTELKFNTVTAFGPARALSPKCINDSTHTLAGLEEYRFRGPRKTR